MTDQADVSERWYDVNLATDLEAFDAALVTTLSSMYPASWLLPDHARLSRLIEEHGGLHNRGTWLCIMPAGVLGHTIDIRHRQPDGTYATYQLSPAETLELVGWKL